jgi:hypothetical protein
MITYSSSIPASFGADTVRIAIAQASGKNFPRSVTFRRFVTASVYEGVKALIANSKERERKMQNSKAGRQTVSKTAVRHQVSILMSIVLLIALSSVTRAQVECLGQCEQTYATCVGNSGHIPILAAICQDNYEACVNACLGSVEALLG